MPDPTREAKQFSKDARAMACESCGGSLDLACYGCADRVRLLARNGLCACDRHPVGDDLETCLPCHHASLVEAPATATLQKKCRDCGTRLWPEDANGTCGLCFTWPPVRDRRKRATPAQRRAQRRRLDRVVEMAQQAEVRR